MQGDKLRTFRITEYTGAINEEALDEDAPPTSLSKIGLNYCARVLTYGLHEGLISIPEEHVLRLIRDTENFVLVTRDLGNRRVEGAGAIVACACVNRLRSLRTDDLRVTDFAIDCPFPTNTAVCRSLLEALKDISLTEKVHRVIFESSVQQKLVTSVEVEGFKHSEVSSYMKVLSAGHKEPPKWERPRTRRSGTSLGDMDERLDMLLD